MEKINTISQKLEAADNTIKWWVSGSAGVGCQSHLLQVQDLLWSEDSYCTSIIYLFFLSL